MKLGMIFECGEKGADKKVCEHIVQMIDSEIEVESITLDNKPNLIEQCGVTAEQLLENGCDRVLIIWDLYPAWREDGQNPCRKEDKEKILDKLTEVGLADEVYLICITEELEAWLLTDGRAVSAALSTSTRRIKIKDEKNPEGVKNPKMKMNRHFTQNIGRPYVDFIHAEKIIKELLDFSRLRRCPSFARFVLKATDTSL